MDRAARLLGRLSFVVALAAAFVAAPVVGPARARAQAPADAAPGTPHRITGRLTLGTAKGLQPLAGMRVTLHRVGPDTAGPLDSALTARDGGYTFTYRPFGSPDAVYFVSARYGGIAYFSEPTRGEDASGDAAAITVFDTTSGPVRVRLAGHHVVVSAPGTDGRREIAEVLDLANDTSVIPVYRTFSLLEQLKGRVRVPTILFYPGVLDGAAGLRFMGVLDAEHNYRPKIL